MSYTQKTSVIILASGRGSRLGELTRSKPKPLHEFDGKPYLGRVVDALLAKQFNDIVITTCIHHQQIENFTQHHYGPEVRTIVEPELISTVKSTEHGLKAIRNKHVIIMTADNIWSLDTAKLLAQHYRTSADATVMVTANPNVPNAGLVRVVQNEERIVQMWSTSTNASDALQTRPASTMGIYVVDGPKLLANIQPDDTSIEREPMGRLNHIVPYWNEGFFFDYGTPENYYFLQRHPELISQYVTNF